MNSNAIPCKVLRRGGSLGLTLAKEVREQLPWRHGDVVAVRVCGEKLVIERLPMEGFARIRTGEVVSHAASLFEP